MIILLWALIAVFALVLAWAVVRVLGFLAGLAVTVVGVAAMLFGMIYLIRRATRRAPAR